MEFDLGLQCNKKDCKQLDFLPFTCDKCKLKFCLDHRTYKAHECTEHKENTSLYPLCPLCSVPVPVLEGQDANEEMEQHILRGCKPKKLNTNHCSVKGCRSGKESLIFAVKCNKCNKQHCLRHRSPYDHNCEVLKQEQLAKKKTVGPFIVDSKAAATQKRTIVN